MDLLAECPEEGRYTDASGDLVACVSPERDDADSVVATHFELCDDAYAWSGDDQQGEDPSPVRACAGEDFQLLFCPSGVDQSGGNELAPPDPETPVPTDSLGAYPYVDSALTSGGTMTFTNVGAPGWWPRRIDREPGDPGCDFKDGEDTWGGHCCMTAHETESSTLSPFDEEMTLILKAIQVKQLAVYQPEATAEGAWHRVTAYDDRTGQSDNLWFTRDGDGSTDFMSDMTGDDCVGYVNQVPLFDCGDGSDYYCPDDPGVLHQGYRGSKLVAFLGSMQFDDSGVSSCSGDGDGNPGPWVAFVASELVRDGGRKWNGLCNCYSKTDTVGDGCGEINVFEVVQDGNEYSNREFASTGVRSYQAGHVGGAVCGSGCERDAFPQTADVVDACAGTGYEAGPELEVGGDTDGCPVWRRPEGDRYFFILLDEPTRSIQVGILHPGALPDASLDVFPEFPAELERAGVDGLLGLRLH
jgi:hypothetical protein